MGKQDEKFGRDVRAKMIREALDGIYLGQLKAIALVMTGYYLFAGISHMFFVAEEIRVILVSLALLASSVSFATYLLVRWNRISAKHSHVAFLPAALSALGLIYAHIGLTGDIYQLSNIVISLLAFGFITLLPAVFIGLTVFASAFYILFLVLLGGPLVAHFAFLGFASVVLGSLCFSQRYKTLSNVERLLILNRSKSQALAFRAQEAKRLQEEAEAAADEARRANEAKSVFLSNTTHELRTPLTGVLGMMRLLEKSDLDDLQRQYLGAAKFSADTLLALINDILDLARMEEGKLVLKRVRFNAALVAQQIVDLLRPTAEEKGLVLNFHADEASVPDTIGDSVRVGQVLFNLLGNAIKFTEKGQIDFYLRSKADEEEAIALDFEVVDTGEGFSEEDAKRLFSRFEQADGTSVKKQAGAGLGLAICKELVDLMDGTLGAEGKVGEGARFSFQLALPVASSALGQSAVIEDVATAVVDISLPEGLDVLVAEDNNINRMLIEKLLEPLGWNVRFVHDGQEAVDAVKETAFDLVLMDVRMPGMDGIEATRTIRAGKGRGSRVPIIALTANTMAEDIVAYRAAGMDAVVGKPIQHQELRSAVSGVLASQQKADQPT
ncbi:MAG: response regulator [Alphaproteobacteria bacterium]|nr:response regulator [Alphaproteobacteria bacterium]